MKTTLPTLEPLNRITIANPCPASWKRMKGDEQVRHCDQCDLNVYNLSEMSASEATDLIQRKEGRLCVRFYRRMDGTVITSDCSGGLRWRIWKWLRKWTASWTAALPVFLFLPACAQRTMGMVFDEPSKLALTPSPGPAPQVEVADAGSQPRPQPVRTEQEPMQWPKDWSDHVGKLVAIEGIAIGMKAGAALFGEGPMIFIDGIQWPDGYYLGGDRGKRVRVTGTVIERHDLPVFIPKTGEPVVQGIPVSEGTDLQKASRRFLIQNAKCVVVE